MPYDKTLDECVVSKTWESETGRIVVSVFSYNKGQKKLQISRENTNAEGEYRFAKLGRMTKEELTAILPLLEEVKDSLD
ncbi:MAG: hypothetical protein ACI9CF_001747 [Candidatus Omnitrophota bacterium]|jgi:hypothetical protein